MRQIHFGLGTLITLSVLSSPSLAITIVGVRTDTEVVIGADSKSTVVHAPGTRQNCKMGIANNIVWSLAGVSQTGDYVPKDDIQSYLLAPGTLSERIKNLESNMEKKLTDVAQAWKRDNLEVFAEHIDGKVIMGMLFAIEDGGVLRMFRSTFGIPKGKGGIVTTEREDFPSQLHPRTGHAVLGTPVTKAAIKKETESRPRLFDQLGPEQSVKHLIDIAINADPAMVGEPVSIIRVDKQGVKWISHGVCQG